MSMLPKIIVILGPTASGKSDLAIKIARKFNGEIISADSRQIYRGMDIGTAKPPISPARQNRAGAKLSALPTGRAIMPVYSQGIPHYLIDIKSPNQSYTVAQYKKDAVSATRKILKKSKLPILVGGTGLYIKAVVDNLEIPEVKPNPRLRQKLEKELNEKGLNYLYEKLIVLDPEAVYIIDRHNPRRVIRALEITLFSKKPFSQQRKQGEKLFDALKIGINLDKEKLKNKIEKRVNFMVNDGLISETKKLIKKYRLKLPVFDAIGYREIINYLEGKIPLSEAINQIKRNTWLYAKRQMTWFKRDKEIIWLKNIKEAENLIKKFL